MLTRPTVNEYPPFYKRYIDLVPEQDLFSFLEQQSKEVDERLRDLPEDKWGYRYAPNKWRLKEVVGHIIDTELIMHFRLFHISRGDHAPLSGFDQEDYIQASPYGAYDPNSLLDYHKNVRQTTLSTLKGLTDDDWLKQGCIDDQPISTRSLAFIIAGHTLHHLNMIKEKYL
ncbi:hypothetical protein JOD43_004099 [Pullulanibacillus pueri]|uniref:DinB-like domain-containing protein n=1 Tax=Pullulanibacillus pueri TaxID=1437324 RepID=A0A8J3ENW5_9BACL|nr:DinB family protein [Pullulanibacillus pueri]MBM7683903.1 hypothetical protein [Pullulanibacillus pueri]GGH87824.1 hypothetical protein GCM10007096_38730 [Pullulanibacillus pueri]